MKQSLTDALWAELWGSQDLHAGWCPATSGGLCACGVSCTTSANTAGDAVALTGKDIIEAMDRVRRELGPPPPSVRFDLYGHGMGNGQAYELPSLEDYFGAVGEKGRRTLVVPRACMERWEDELRRAGCDVRVEPRIQTAQKSPDQTNETNHE